jgi:hypothetical protein
LLVLYKLYLLIKVRGCVVVIKSLSFPTLKKHLANKIKCVRATAEAIIKFIKLKLAGKKVNYIIVITYIVKYKVANFISSNTKQSQYCKDNLTYPLT